MHSIHNARESLGQIFFDLTDVHFKNKAVDFRAVAALLVGGIYYMILHTSNNGHKFADIDFAVFLFWSTPKDHGIMAWLVPYQPTLWDLFRKAGRARCYKK